MKYIIVNYVSLLYLDQEPLIISFYETKYVYLIQAGIFEEVIILLFDR